MGRFNPAVCRPSSRQRAAAGLGAFAAALVAGSAFAQQAPTQQGQAQSESVLRVCADPNNLPLSNDKGEGYENRIAEELARDLGRRVAYTYFPQRMGFVRNTLRQKDVETQQFKCDVIIGVPKGYELTATTRPYMRSTYALVFPWREDFENLHAANDLLSLAPEKRSKLRIGVFGRSPGSDWLLRNDLMDHAVVYAPQSGDPAESPAHIVEQDLAAKKIDAAIVWGPIAGYLVRRHSAHPQWLSVPFMPDENIKFDYEISMGVRFGEKEWKDTLDQWIGAHQDKVEQILLGFRVPLLDADGKVIANKAVAEQARARSVQEQIPLQLERNP
jgi:quinoprotein dehydrogenase-associated probable ABC transporter substrate-binding protein